MVGSMTARGEIKHSPDILDRMRVCAESGMSQTEAARVLGIRQSWVARHGRHLTWKHRGVASFSLNARPAPKHITPELAASHVHHVMCALAAPSLKRRRNAPSLVGKPR